MIVFWIAAVALSIAVFAGLSWPLLRRPQLGSNLTRVDYDLSVYKDQLLEVTRDIERGVLSQDQAQAARAEIERRMLGAAQKKSPAQTGDGVSTSVHPVSTRVLIALILVVIPLGSLALYWRLGQPGMRDFPYAQRSHAAAQNQIAGQPSVAQLDAMIKDIKARLAKDPKSPRNWLILGRTYEMRGDMSNAVGAYEKLVETSNRFPGAVLTLAEAKFKLSNRIMNDAIMALFKEGKAKDPTNPMPYYYLAVGQEQFKNFPAALKEYVGLLQHSPENANWISNIQMRMKNVAKKMGVAVPVVKMLPPLEAASKAPPSGGPTAQQVQEAQKMTPAQRQVLIRSMVDLLAQKLQKNPDDLAGWRRLANAYKILGDKDKLAEVEANIKRLQAR